MQQVITIYRSTHILEKALLSKTLSMTGTSLSADEFKCMEIVLFSPSVIFTESSRLIVTPTNPCNTEPLLFAAFV